MFSSVFLLHALGTYLALLCSQKKARINRLLALEASLVTLKFADVSNFRIIFVCRYNVRFHS